MLVNNTEYATCQRDPVSNATMAIWYGSLTPLEAMTIAQADIEACVAEIGP